jgi:hypothetical protein
MPARIYPKEMIFRAVELRKQGLIVPKIVSKLIEEFPGKPTENLQTVKCGAAQTISNWFHLSQYGDIRDDNEIPNNKIELDDEELGIIEQFALTSQVELPTSDRFAELTQNIPSLLAEKREELMKIQKQIHQLEIMSKALDEDKTEPELEATGSD